MIFFILISTIIIYFFLIKIEKMDNSTNTNNINNDINSNINNNIRDNIEYNIKNNINNNVNNDIRTGTRSFWNCNDFTSKNYYDKINLKKNNFWKRLTPINKYESRIINNNIDKNKPNISNPSNY